MDISTRTVEIPPYIFGGLIPQIWWKFTSYAYGGFGGYLHFELQVDRFHLGIFVEFFHLEGRNMGPPFWWKFTLIFLTV